LAGKSVLMLCLAGAVGCREAEPAWMAEVERAHARADQAVAADERHVAFEVLERAYRAVPGGEDPHLFWIRQDLCVRLADTALADGRSDVALRWADTGLGLSAVPSVALADLYRVRGDALEALGRKDEAISALHQALLLNQTLMERALGGNPPGDATR
jgi:hypothetical protein